MKFPIRLERCVNTIMIIDPEDVIWTEVQAMPGDDPKKINISIGGYNLFPELNRRKVTRWTVLHVFGWCWRVSRFTVSIEGPPPPEHWNCRCKIDQLPDNSPAKRYYQENIEPDPEDGIHLTVVIPTVEKNVTGTVTFKENLDNE